MACAGDIPTLEALTATDILRTHIPDLKIRFVYVVDLLLIVVRINHVNFHVWLS